MRAALPTILTNHRWWARGAKARRLAHPTPTLRIRFPLIHPLQGLAHQYGAVARGQPVGDEERVDALFVGQEPGRAGPVGAPQAAVEPEGVEDARERIPDVFIRKRLARER